MATKKPLRRLTLSIATKKEADKKKSEYQNKGYRGVIIHKSKTHANPYTIWGYK